MELRGWEANEIVPDICLILLLAPLLTYGRYNKWFLWHRQLT